MDDQAGPEQFAGEGERQRAVHALQGAAQAAGGLYLGRGQGGWAWSAAEQCVLVLGPARSGKTSSLIIPNVLAARGAVVSTSTKPELMEMTARSRRTAGRVMLYDPSGTVPVPDGVTAVGWSPVTACDDWERALSGARAMVRAARLTEADGGSAPHLADHWSERATALLAPLLHAGAITGAPMSTVLAWIDRHDGTDALDVLARERGDGHPSTNVLSGILATDPREQSGIWSTASGILSAYRSPAALRSTEPPLLDAAAFCEAPNTLFICAAGRHQALLAPLVVGVITDVRDAAYERAAEGATGPPVLLALDEAANIAPVPDLPSMVTEGAGQGLITLACFQDLSQARSRWGQRAEAFLSLFGTTVVLPGIADTTTLEALSLLAGEEELAVRTVGRSVGPDGRARPSVSVSTLFRRRLPVDVIARGRDGAALCVDARNRMGWVGLTPAFRDNPWRAHLMANRPLARPEPLADQERPIDRVRRSWGRS